MRQKLLVLELWGLGDLIIGSHFLISASEKFDVTVVAKPFAVELGRRFWPGVKVVPFVAPWTAFRRKYRFVQWDWRQMMDLRRRLVKERFDIALSARWDPRDHVLLAGAGVGRRVGFPRMGSRVLLNYSLPLPPPRAHRYEYWRLLGEAIGLDLADRPHFGHPRAAGKDVVLIHTGAGQTLRVWPLERFRALAKRLREAGYRVQIACDRDQRPWWLQAGEMAIRAPRSVPDLMELIEQAGVFIGNDSGPGHLAAWCGVPTLTVFGPQLPEWFAPLDRASEWIEGKACPHKPCLDYCRFAEPHCILGLTEEEVWARVFRFVTNHLGVQPGGR
jgi:ADP-heptose:LPS heptosyltransferase